MDLFIFTEIDLCRMYAYLPMYLLIKYFCDILSGKLVLLNLE